MSELSEGAKKFWAKLNDDDIDPAKRDKFNAALDDKPAGGYERFLEMIGPDEMTDDEIRQAAHRTWLKTGVVIDVSKIIAERQEKARRS